MKKIAYILWLCIVTITAACAPSSEEIQSLVGTAVASLPTATTMPTYTPYPTYTPFPTYTPLPTETSTPTTAPVAVNTAIPVATQPMLDENALRVRLLNEVAAAVEAQIFVMQVNAAYWNGPDLEVEAQLRSQTYDLHAPDHFTLVTLIAQIMGNQLYEPIVTDQTHLVLITLPGERSGRYVSVTDYETLQLLNQNAITFDEWKDLANYGSR